MSFKKSTVSVSYKSLDFSDCELEDIDTFTGFVVVKERGKISYIREMQDGIEITSIKFRPTQIPTIVKAQYGNYYEERYNSNSISTKAHIVKGELEGEYRRYSPDGDCLFVKYYSSGKDVTAEVIEFLGLTYDIDKLHNYKFSTEEEFNLMMRYGSHFKFLYEYNIDSSTFDSIVQSCL